MRSRNCSAMRAIGNVVDVDLLVANEREQQIERARELRSARRRRLRLRGRQSYSRRPLTRNDDMERQPGEARRSVRSAGVNHIMSSGLPNEISRKRMTRPYRAETLVRKAPRRRQQVLHHVRAVERRNRNQIERREHDVELNTEHAASAGRSMLPMASAPAREPMA